MLHRVKSLWTPFPRTGPAALRLPAACFAIALFAAAVVGWIRLGPVWFAGLLLAAPIVATTLLHAVYWSNIRMRAPLEPLLAILAVAAIASSRRIDPPTA